MPIQDALLPLDEALARLAAAIPAPVAPALRADRDDPALDLALLDGAALRAEDGLAPRQVLGTLCAGEDPAAFTVAPGTCVRLMTGAALPAGANALVPVEALEEAGDGRLRPRAEPRPGDGVRQRASQARAGEALLGPGPWTPARVGLAAQVGAAWPVPRRLRVAVAPTGDELALHPEPHQIRDAAGPMLQALAHTLGAEARLLPPLPDAPRALERALSGLEDLDVLLTLGGVSMGDRDHLPDVLRALGAETLFHRIRLRPGKPLMAARWGSRVVLALPGNPVAAYLDALLFLPVALARLEGRPQPDPWFPAELLEAVPNGLERPLLQPCRLEEGRLRPLPSRGSADLVRLAQAQACAWIPEGGAPKGPVRALRLP